MIIHSVSGQNQRQYVCVCARVWGTYRQTYAQAYALTEINVSAWVCIHTCTYIYICIHTYTHKLSSRVLFSAVVLLFFASFSFSTITTRSRIRYRNAFLWWGSGSEGRSETALVGKSSSDTQTFAESTSTTSCLCFEHVHTYIHRHVYMYSCTHIRTAVFSCVAYTPHSPLTVYTFACWLQLSQAQHHKRRIAEKQNRNEIVYAFALNSLHTVARVCGLDVQIYIHTYVHAYVCE